MHAYNSEEEEEEEEGIVKKYRMALRIKCGEFNRWRAIA